MLSLTANLFLWSPFAAADFDAGQKAYGIGDYETALREWQPLAEAGDKRAQFGLGTMYANGFGVALDDAQAFHWLELSAAQEYAEAQYKLGVMHQNGWGVPMSDKEAAGWFGRAAELGHTDAQIALGRICAASYGDFFDPVTAYKWFAIAVKLNDMDAVNKLADVAKELSPEQIAQADVLVSEWLQAHASSQEE